MSFDPFRAVRWLVGLLILLYVGVFVLNHATSLWQDKKSHPAAKFVGEEAAKFVKIGTGGMFGSGGVFGSSDDPDALVKAKRKAQEDQKEIDNRLVRGRKEHLRKAEDYADAQKAAGIVREWKPLINWDDAVTATSGPGHVQVWIVRTDTSPHQKVGSVIINKWAKDQDISSLLTNGATYVFQAFLPNSRTTVSGTIGPLVFAEGVGWQTSSGRDRFQTTLRLQVNL